VPDPLDRLQEGLAERYRIQRELGRGGMATVYLAQDLRHDRPVALKLLHPDLAASLGPDRFLREIKLAARLQHPHILSVHDSGEAAGRLWFSMPYVQGESLRARLARDRQLPVEEAVRIAIEAARALDYAHRHGVIHRDIKPENIMLTSEGDTLVADFGIGRALEAPELDDRLTGTGIVVGTPTYMSPEQGAGERRIDGRSDVYSLGVVLYEMLAGEPPFTGPTAQAVIGKRLSGDPPPLRRLRPAVPEPVERAVMKALARNPADRYSTGGEFARALAATAGPAERRPHRISVLAPLIGLLLLAGAGVLWQSWLRRTAEPGGPKRLAVLPFENLGEPEDEYFADGVTDAVRGKLTALSGLRVTARGSCTPYKRSRRTPREIGKQLGVHYLLTGTVRWQRAVQGEHRVQVSPELIEVATGAARWQQPFDAAMTDVFDVQAQIASRVAQALDLALGAGERQSLVERPTQSLAAYDAYLRGEEFSDAMGASDPATLREALSHYERAAALDSAFAPAWGRLAQIHAVLYYVGEPQPERQAISLAAAERARDLAPDRPEGYLALGEYHYRMTGEFDSALAQYQHGRVVAPRNADLLVGVALAEQNLGRWEASLAHLREAAVQDPRSVLTARRIARTLLWMRRYPEAMEAVDRALSLAPGLPVLQETKAMIHLAQGDLAGARRVLDASGSEIQPAALAAYVAQYWDLFWALSDEQKRLVVRLPPSAFDDNRASWALVRMQVHALQGDRTLERAYADSARAELQGQLRRTPDEPQLHTLLGLALAHLGRRVEAMREGERAVALKPVKEDATQGAYIQHQLARIYLLVGENEKALDRLEPLMKLNYYVSPAWLRIDPAFIPLRDNPRFERLSRAP
jgi:eukaryotic-like serine/threonine-protein kinase